MKAILFILSALSLAVWLTLDKGWPPRPADHAQPAAETASESAGKTIRIIAEGRMAAYPGAEVTLSNELPAVIMRLPVKEKDRVRKGDLVAELKADDIRAQAEEAKARIAETEANIRLLDLEIERIAKLWESRQASRQELDRYLSQREVQRAQREARAADARRLQAMLAKTLITSPIDGVVTSRNADAGEMIAVGTPIVTVTDLGRLRVEAELDEFDAGRIRLGDAVTVTAEGYPGKAMRGVVEEIPDAVVGRRLKPQDPSRPIDTRVLLVKIALKEPPPFKLGQRVDLEIFTGGQAR
ncbi:MAG: efflux RND transporter periplasmic adaptor subunit [Candidatus Methylumidiphilus sp.]